jgi:hypothetical protein
MNGSRVPIPAQVRRPFQVFVNGVLKREGADYVVRGDQLVFAEPLVQPRQMTMKTYARLMFWGRYKTEHSVDIAYDAGGRRVVASGLEILPPADAEAQTTE